MFESGTNFGYIWDILGYNVAVASPAVTLEFLVKEDLQVSGVLQMLCVMILSLVLNIYKSLTLDTFPVLLHFWAAYPHSSPGP